MVTNQRPARWNYQQYRRTFRKVTLEAEGLYYREMFDTRTNSVKKLWRNLNTVCSLQKSNCKTNNISRLITKGSTLIDNNRISDGIYNYFSTIDKKVDEKHSQKNSNFNYHDFKSYCHKPHIHVFKKSDAKIQITITTAYLIRIKYPLSGFNYHLSDVNVANFNKMSIFPWL